MSAERVDEFDEERAAGYDERIRQVSVGYESMHACVGAVLGEALPERAEILVCGSGTGREIVELAGVSSGWRFTAVDPSPAMLSQCEARLGERGVADRVSLICDEIQAVEGDRYFDAATSIYVAHFIQEMEERVQYFEAIGGQLKEGGVLAFADLYRPEAESRDPSMKQVWRRWMRHNGMSDEAVADAFERIDSDISFLREDELASCLKQAGFGVPRRFFQALMWGGWLVGGK